MHLHCHFLLLNQNNDAINYNEMREYLNKEYRDKFYQDKFYRDRIYYRKGSLNIRLFTDYGLDRELFYLFTKRGQQAKDIENRYNTKDKKFVTYESRSQYKEQNNERLQYVNKYGLLNLWKKDLTESGLNYRILYEKFYFYRKELELKRLIKTQEKELSHARERKVKNKQLELTL